MAHAAAIEMLPLPGAKPDGSHAPSALDHYLSGATPWCNPSPPTFTPTPITQMLCQAGAKPDALNARHQTPADLCITDAARDVLKQYNWGKLISGKDVAVQVAVEVKGPSAKEE